jgi:hypothetical protein
MDESNVIALAGREASTDPLTELLREGARKLIAEAVQAELTSSSTGFPSAVPRTAEPRSFATATTRSESCRQASDRSR